MALIGIIEEMEKEGMNMTSLAASSIGALVGAVYLSGKLEEFKERITELSRLDLLKLMDLAVNEAGFIKGDKIFKEMKSFITVKNLEDFKIPFIVTAVDIMRREEIILDKGSTLQAVRASVAIPMVFRPVEMEGRLLVDGGTMNPLPMNLTKRKQGELLMGVDLNAGITYEPPEGYGTKDKEPASSFSKARELVNKKWNEFVKNKGRDAPKSPAKDLGFFDFLLKSLHAVEQKLTRIALKETEPDILVEISIYSCGMHEFQKASELIEYGRKQFRKAMTEWREKQEKEDHSSN